ncbi:MAG: hypothetical protein AAFU69_00075 [Pseudomonadota bacterium]
MNICVVKKREMRWATSNLGVGLARAREAISRTVPVELSAAQILGKFGD